MPYDLYWYGSWDAVFCYMDKAKLEAKEKYNEMQTKAWLHGLYFKIALIDVAPIMNGFIKDPTVGHAYPKEPFLDKEQERELTDEEINKLAYLKMKQYSGVVNQNFKAQSKSNIDEIACKKMMEYTKEVNKFIKKGG